MPYLSVSERGTVSTPSTLPPRSACTVAICRRHGVGAVDQVVREMHEERLVADDGLRTPHGVTETERRRLPDVDAARPRRHDVLQRLEQVDLALRFERLLQLDDRVSK